MLRGLNFQPIWNNLSVYGTDGSNTMYARDPKGSSMAAMAMIGSKSTKNGDIVLDGLVELEMSDFDTSFVAQDLGFYL